MDKLDLIMWMIGGGFSVGLGLLTIVWSSLTTRIEKLDEKLTDVDRRVCRIEGALNNKDCCMIKDSNTMRKAE